MTDVGTADAIEADILAAIEATPIRGLSRAVASLSVDDLIFRDGQLGNAVIGICDADAAFKNEHSANVKSFLAATLWEVSVVVKNERGAVEGRRLRRFIQETVRDRLQWLVSSQGRKFQWLSEKPTETGKADLLASVATYGLDTLFGKP
ncbi:MAG: hypothetical protein ABIT01_19600 [Thermoanaerobaculia bacterium]